MHLPYSIITTALISTKQKVGFLNFKNMQSGYLITTNAYPNEDEIRNTAGHEPMVMPFEKYKEKGKTNLGHERERARRPLKYSAILTCASAPEETSTFMDWENARPVILF